MKRWRKCNWAEDTEGFYITPLLGVSKVKGIWEIWIGWFYWLFTYQITKTKED